MNNCSTQKFRIQIIADQTLLLLSFCVNKYFFKASGRKKICRVNSGKKMGRTFDNLSLPRNDLFKV